MKSMILSVLVAVGIGGCTTDEPEVPQSPMSLEEAALIEDGYERVDLIGIDARLEGITAADLPFGRVYAKDEVAIDESAIHSAVPTCNTYQYLDWTQVYVHHVAIFCGVVCQPIKYWYAEPVSATTSCDGSCSQFTWVAWGYAGGHPGHLTAQANLDPNDPPEISTTRACLTAN